MARPCRCRCAAVLAGTSCAACRHARSRRRRSNRCAAAPKGNWWSAPSPRRSRPCASRPRWPCPEQRRTDALAALPFPPPRQSRTASSARYGSTARAKPPCETKPMRLTTIKLAGFKSFVDPTTLHLPTNMTGVVGPNGCGKSNIIDAVRWVMGESSASRLRGDNLTDVIFSGSSTRKPVGTATVELLFDNSDGLIAGEFARFNEISVKRSVSRDGTSVYYLNGARCRRRDITDLFLGTRLGPRRYSIIEQRRLS